jgi:Cu/Ag efflux protein CusF
MKFALRLSVSIFAASLILPFACGQDASATGGAPPPERQGMAAFAEHGVRGTVTAVSGDNLTVKTENGDVYKIETGPNTRFRKQRDQIKISDIHVGDMVAAGGDKDDKAKTVGAVFVMLIDKEQYEKARADFGKTWTAGAIQSIEETKITIKRPDNVVQTIVVDENTSFRKRRDSITLADIKVGDNVSARGSLQNGNFLATVLSVGGPGGPGGGPGGGSGGGRGGYGGNRGAGNAQPAPASASPAPPNQ